MHLFILIGGALVLLLFAQSKASAGTVSVPEPGQSADFDDSQDDTGLAAAIRVNPNLPPYWELYQKAGLKYGVDWRLIAAHARVESSYDPEAYNPEGDGGDGSYGLMQIYLVIGPKGTPTNKLSYPGFSSLKPADVLVPAKNVDIGAYIIASNMKAYGFPRGIAVYNDWSAHTAPLEGPFPNDPYVWKVKSAYANLQNLFPAGSEQV